VQLTPPGSGCSIVVGKGVVEMTPRLAQGPAAGGQGHRAARAQLVERGGGGRRGPGDRRLGTSPGPGREDLDNVGFVFFSDPDGNGWAVQQISARD
jgi:hypothetical protein